MHLSVEFGTDKMDGRGGEEVLLDVGGQDATEAFEDVGHSDEAREILDGLLVGDVKRMVRCPNIGLGELCGPNQYSVRFFSFGSRSIVQSN